MFIWQSTHLATRLVTRLATRLATYLATRIEEQGSSVQRVKIAVSVTDSAQAVRYAVMQIIGRCINLTSRYGATQAE
jgi:hypothetical protein